MKIIPFGQDYFRQFALIGLLYAPFIFNHSLAAELVGKPAAVGQAATSVAAKSAQVASSAAAANQAAPSAGTSPVPAVAPVPSVEPPPVPSVPSPPSPDDMNEMSHDIDGAMDDLGNGLDEVFGRHRDDSGFRPEILIPIVLFSLLFGGPVVVVIVLAWFYYRAKARRQQNINANIDKLLAAGRDIPVELLLGEEAAIRTQTNGFTQTAYLPDQMMMQKGMRNIGLGTGWLLFLTIMFGIKIGSFGFIFIGLGISQVIIWKLSAPRVQTFNLQPGNIQSDNIQSGNAQPVKVQD